MTKQQFELNSPYGYLTPKFESHRNIWNGSVGTVLENGRVRFEGLRETVEVPRHWRKPIKSGTKSGTRAAVQ